MRKPLLLLLGILVFSVSISIGQQEDTVIYRDDFSDGDSWFVGSSVDGVADYYYEDESYIIDLKVRNMIAWVWQYLELPNTFTIKADFTSKDGASTGFGFYWGGDGNDGYFFIASIARSVVYVYDIAAEAVVGKQVPASLNRVGKSNTLALRLNGDTVTLFANGSEKATVAVNPIPHPIVGLLSVNWGFKNARVEIDNLVITSSNS